ncbi:hypothetical protein EVAR_48899_1 [Eumeta japonica]|uniref:Uncharacterized protein n=1 Tax=Eumeta variegata TaxID=151549 RepID=A0A4C1YT26_EUMVA|nr:hypothetical protein EVAR_48899_1 [Eumeta japonica]
MPRFGHTKLFAGKTATCSYCADKTHEWEKCPRRKQNEEPKCKNCWENGIKTEANHEAFSNKCKKWTQNDSDDSSESPEIQSSDCRVTPAGDRERDIDSLGSGTLCRKPRHPKTKSRHQSNTVHCRPPEASESGDNCFRRQSRGFT